MDAQYSIYTGVWVDWSHDKVFGTTLTTTRTHGSLLIAFLSLSVTIVGTSFWRICCFALHYNYSTEASRDATYHQRQAVLRNAANASTGIVSLFSLMTTWRKVQPATTSYRIFLPLLAFSCLVLAAFAVASTFSSRVASATGNSVLLSGNNCGIMTPWNVENTTEFATIYQPYLSKRSTSDGNYVEQCYPDVHDTEGCNTFVSRRLPINITRDAGCPFLGDICKSEDANLVLDTGLIDSHHNLGLNAPPRDRYQFRVVLQSAPLRTKNYSQQVENIWPDQSNSYVRYQYGATVRTGMHHSDFTYQHIVPQREEYIRENFTGPQPAIDLRIESSQVVNGLNAPELSTWVPIHELQRSDADLYIAFLSLNSLMFSEQTEDLWYSAHEYAGGMANQYSSSLEDESRMYWSDEPASPMGLVQQYQFCKPDLPAEIRCTPLLSRQDAYDAAVGLWNEDERAMERFGWHVTIFQGPQDALWVPISVLGSAVLESKARMSDGFIGPLSSNQWQLDIEKLFNTTLASFQQNFVTAATGPSDPRQKSLLEQPPTDATKEMCRNQKILSTAYTNFSVFGLCAILIIGGIIIILSYTLEPLITSIQRRRNLDVYARLEWSMNETLQLQRLAHEELGLGTWTRCDKDVPVTARFERLGVLDVTERTHPRLKMPPAGFEDEIHEEGEEVGEAKGRMRGDQQKPSGRAKEQHEQSKPQVVSMVGVEERSDGSISQSSDGSVCRVRDSASTDRVHVNA